MKVILAAEHTGKTDGWGTYTTILCDALRRQGHTVIVCCTRRMEAGERPVLARPVLYLSRPFTIFFSARRIARIFREEQADLLHITVEPFATMIPFLPKTVRERTVVTFHGSYGVRLLNRFLSRWLMKRAFASLSACITVSRFTKHRLVEEIAARTNRGLADHFARIAHVIHNAIDLPRETMSEREDRNEKRVLLVGPLKPRKGILEALEACAAYRKAYGSVPMLSVVGTTEPSAYSQAVEQRIADLSLADCVRIEGPVSSDKLAELYRSADLLLLPARTTETTFEGFGLVYLEAASYGVPSIGPNDGGAVEAIAEGESGYRIDPADPQAIADGMHRILEEKSITPEQCRAWAKKFSSETVAAQFEHVYALLTQEGSSD